MRLELPEQKKLVFELTMPIRWGDMDAMGHVNNTVYFRYLETARIDWLRAVGCSLGTTAESAVTLNAFCNFHKQLEYPGDILVKLFVSDPARATFESWHTIERVDQPGVVYASGGATIIWVDFPRQKSKDLPDWLRKIVS